MKTSSSETNMYSIARMVFTLCPGLHYKLEYGSADSQSHVAESNRTIVKVHWSCQSCEQHLIFLRSTLLPAQNHVVPLNFLDHQEFVLFEAYVLCDISRTLKRASNCSELAVSELLLSEMLAFVYFISLDDHNLSSKSRMMPLQMIRVPNNASGEYHGRVFIEDSPAHFYFRHRGAVSAQPLISGAASSAIPPTETGYFYV